jgi:hypothetical protein
VLRTFEGVEPMGRGRAKAKQVKVARQLKYNSGGTDLDRLRSELGVGSEHHDDHDGYDADSEADEDDEDGPESDDDNESDDPEEMWGRKPARLAGWFEYVLAALCFRYLYRVLAIEAGAA